MMIEENRKESVLSSLRYYYEDIAEEYRILLKNFLKFVIYYVGE